MLYISKIIYYFHQHSKVFFITSCPYIHEGLQMEKKSIFSKFQVMYVPLNSHKLTNYKSEITVPIFFHLLQNLFVVLDIITLLCIIDLFVLDISCLTTCGVMSGFILQEVMHGFHLLVS